MEGCSEKSKKEKKPKLSVGRSISMRFSHLRGRDSKCVGELCNKSGEGSALLGCQSSRSGMPQSQSMNAMDSAVWPAFQDIGVAKGIVNLCLSRTGRVRSSPSPVGPCRQFKGSLDSSVGGQGNGYTSHTNRGCRDQAVERLHCFQCNLERKHRTCNNYAIDCNNIVSQSHDASISCRFNVRPNNLIAVSFPSSRSLPSGLMVNSVGSLGCPLSPHEAPSCPPPAPPPHTLHLVPGYTKHRSHSPASLGAPSGTSDASVVPCHNYGLQGQARGENLSHSWDRIYASRQGTLTLAHFNNRHSHVEVSLVFWALGFSF